MSGDPLSREPQTRSGLFVVTSELRVRPEAADTLVDSFQDRIGLVDAWDDFDRLEVWQDRADRSRFVMTSWWASHDSFLAYMRSNDHRRSHDRIPTGDARPRPVGVDRFDLVAR